MRQKFREKLPFKVLYAASMMLTFRNHESAVSQTPFSSESIVFTK